MLTGLVDKLEDSKLKGWAYNSDAPGEHIVIRINNGTSIVATGVANMLRSDLPGAGIGAGDHAFIIDLPKEITTIEGLMVVAQSQKHGEIALPLADTPQQQATETRYDTFSRRFEKALLTLKRELTEIRESLDDTDQQKAADLPEAFSERLARLENRMDSAEVFFVRIDEMMHTLVEQKKTRRKRFLGIF